MGDSENFFPTLTIILFLDYFEHFLSFSFYTIVAVLSFNLWYPAGTRAEVYFTGLLDFKSSMGPDEGPGWVRLPYPPAKRFPLIFENFCMFA